MMFQAIQQQLSMDLGAKQNFCITECVTAMQSKQCPPPCAPFLTLAKKVFRGATRPRACSNWNCWLSAPLNAANCFQNNLFCPNQTAIRGLAFVAECRCVYIRTATAVWVPQALIRAAGFCHVALPLSGRSQCLPRPPPHRDDANRSMMTCE